MVDDANGMVWAGIGTADRGMAHGPRRALAHQRPRRIAPMFKEALSWRASAHTPVLVIVAQVVCSCVNIDSDLEGLKGSEGGVIKAWPWDAIAKSLSFTSGENHMAASLVEKSYIDLRNNATVGNMCSLPAADVKHMLADRCRAKVWSLTSMTFALWDAKTRELLKVFGIDGQVDLARPEAPVMPEQFIEEEIKVKPTKKEKPQGSFSFFQKSRNALMGAADAVRRVATKGTLVEDNRRTEAVAQAMNGTIWSGCTDGSIIVWDGNGNRLQEFHYHSSSVQCIKTLLRWVLEFLPWQQPKKVGLEGSANGQWWIDSIGKTLDEGISFHRVGSRQLAGLLIAAWASNDLKPHVGDVDAAAVPCGFGRAIGNKGGVGLRIRVFDRRICFINNHFAAHQENVSRRNADFDHIYRTMTFNKPHGSTASATSVQLHKAVSANENQADEDRPELAEADMVVFLGDFNYRLNGITYDEARDMVSQRSFDWLRERDQLRAEMKAGNVFQGMREGPIKFPPTYKFQRHQLGLSGYDLGEKKRIHAWCDRILYRDSRSVSIAECSLECPVVAAITAYEACMDVTDSDHKPVRCTFSVDIERVDELIRRQEFGKIIESNKKVCSLLRELHFVPDTIVSTNNIILENQGDVILRITNNSETSKAAFEILCEGQSIRKQDGTKSELLLRASFGFPLWLEVQPSIGLIEPGETMEVAVHHEDFFTQEEFVDGVQQNWWCEATRDLEVVLSVNVTGSSSTEAVTHRITARH
ncbi:unnamed protein product [Miscanthus lutarioriparius]|uniref:MSP domain-containing protein n=1 Tax=Miscanthus lutarioriparius TaxID=422564 RepID=A0A811R405_9POAL|nr:unnamed protein product [Miscanthus lutarioriparius]